MRHAQAKIDAATVASNTHYAQQYAESTVHAALRFLADDARKERIAKCECKACFYIRSRRIGCAAMTEQPCGVCGKDVMYGSTNTDKLCLDCAKKQELCKYCGGDLHMRPRRVYERRK